jgi:hypothetical protein
MKKIVELSSAEIKHRVEWFEFYKIIANVLFVLLILFSFYISLIGGEKEKIIYQRDSERIAFKECAKSQKESIDTLQWYREIMGK